MNEIATIRFVEENDLLALEWGGEYYRFRNMYREIYHQSLIGNALLWVIELDQFGIIGQVFAQLNSQNPKFADGKSRAYLFSFRVKPQFQRQGWGTRLLNHAENYLFQEGFEYVTLNVSKTNQNALIFYQHRGYIIIGEERGHWTYTDPEGNPQVVDDPSWRMEKWLISRK